jgi:hypothetical protein
LKTWRRPEGRIRLSEDDGPSATEFLDGEFDDDNERLNEGDDDDDDEPLAERAERFKNSNVGGANHGAGIGATQSRA